MTPLTRDEWQTKVANYHRDIIGIVYPVDVQRAWWASYGSPSYGLTHLGYHRFVQAKVEFSEFHIMGGMTITGTVTLGLSRMPCPHYFRRAFISGGDDEGKPIYELSLTEPEFALILAFNGKNLTEFARSFLTPEN